MSECSTSRFARHPQPTAVGNRLPTRRTKLIDDYKPIIDATLAKERRLR